MDRPRLVRRSGARCGRVWRHRRAHRCRPGDACRVADGLRAGADPVRRRAAGDVPGGGRCGRARGLPGDDGVRHRRGWRRGLHPRGLRQRRCGLSRRCDGWRVWRGGRAAGSRCLRARRTLRSRRMCRAAARMRCAGHGVRWGRSGRVHRGWGHRTGGLRRSVYQRGRVHLCRRRLRRESLHARRGSVCRRRAAAVRRRGAALARATDLRRRRAMRRRGVRDRGLRSRHGVSLPGRHRDLVRGRHTAGRRLCGTRRAMPRPRWARSVPAAGVCARYIGLSGWWSVDVCGRRQSISARPLPRLRTVHGRGVYDASGLFGGAG